MGSEVSENLESANTPCIHTGTVDIGFKDFKYHNESKITQDTSYLVQDSEGVSEYKFLRHKDLDMELPVRVNTDIDSIPIKKETKTHKCCLSKKLIDIVRETELDDAELVTAIITCNHLDD